MTGGEWNTSRERKQLAADQREQQREQVRLEKRHLKDLRWALERSTVQASDWSDLIQLQQAHGKEGPMQLWQELIPYWSQCQTLNGGTPCPPSLFPQAICKKLRADGPTSRPTPGAPRKKRSDAGKAQKRTNTPNVPAVKG